jgi:hypothetical protein
MSTVHINTGGGDSIIYEEDQARALWLEGRFSEGALFWREGMSSWQPISVLFPPTAVYQPTPAFRPSGVADKPVFGNDRVGGYRFTKDPTTLTQVLKFLLWSDFILMGLSLLSDISQLSMLKSGVISHEAAEANDARQGLIAMVYLGVFVATVITFGMWVYRANINSRGFGAKNMEFTPGWAVGWYFVPFLNLVRPYQAMKEIWNVSVDPQRWQSVNSSAILPLWWTLWILSRITGQISFRVSMGAETLAALEAATVASIVSGTLDIPLAFVALTLVTRIVRNQKALVHKDGMNG